MADTETSLAALHEIGPRVGFAELRLDLMKSFDLPRLINESPCPLIITCRAPREGGAFKGSEAERHEILTEAMNLNCAYVDVEWDDVAKIRERRRSTTRLIASRHWNDHMPATLWPIYELLRKQADAVKLVGLAESPIDIIPVLDLLRRATTPVIALAMGAAGRLTRLLAPMASQCLLTYGALSDVDATAPGQLTVAEMIDVYHLDTINRQSEVHIHLCSDGASAALIEKSDATLRIPLVVSAEEAPELLNALKNFLPRLHLSADPSFQELLAYTALHKE
jgi:3-dehydroquinate dehydratase type I